MKLLVYSDLHTEGRPFSDIHPDVDQMDVIVLAGDIGVGVGAVDWAVETFEDYGVPVIMVAGNHEFYRGHIDDTLAEMKTAAAQTDFIKVLENEMTIIDDVCFFGCSLWTDFNLYDNAAASMSYAHNCMNDFRLIRTETGMFRPEHTVLLHEYSRNWLDEAMTVADANGKFKKVVVTHHGPHSGSVDKQYEGDLLTPAFVSDLTEMIVKHKPQVWIHGHVHTAFDYVVADTRVVVNPRGYSREQTGFDSKKVVIV